MGSKMIKSCVEATTSDSHSENWGSNPHGAAFNITRRNYYSYIEVTPLLFLKNLGTPLMLNLGLSPL